MSKLVKKQNNRSFIEHFDHVEPYIRYILHFVEEFSHINPPAYSFDFLESFDN